MNNSTIELLSLELELSPDLIEIIYKTYWRAVKQIIESIPLKSMTPLEFTNSRISISFPSLGKLSCLEKMFKKKRKSYERHAEDKKGKTTI